MTHRPRRSSLVPFLVALGLALSLPAFARAQSEPVPAEPIDEEPAPEEAPPEEAPSPPPEAPAEEVAEEAPPPPPPPAPVVPFKPTGSFFTRYELRQNYDELGVSGGRFTEGDFAVFRARLGLTVGAIDLGRGISTSLQFTPQATGVIGQLGTPVAGGLGNTVVDANVGLYEGYLRAKGSTVTVDVGRFMMNYGDSLVIGSLDWHQTARSFDGVRARIAPGTSGFYVDAFATFTLEGWPSLNSPFGAGDQYFAGIYADFGPLVASGMALEAYLLTLASPRTRNALLDPTNPMMGVGNRQSAVEETIGARFKHRVGLVDLRAEAGVQFGSRLRPNGAAGTNVDAVAYQVDAELGLNFLDNDFRVGLEGLYASGNDPSTATNEGWNQLFPTAHKFLGLSDAFGARTNAASAVLHLMYKPVAGLTAAIDAHLLLRPEQQPIPMSGMPPMTADGYAATEIDVNLGYLIGPGLLLRGLYAAFLPNEDLYPSDSVLHYMELELRYDLK